MRSEANRGSDRRDCLFPAALAVAKGGNEQLKFLFESRPAGFSRNRAVARGPQSIEVSARTRRRKPYIESHLELFPIAASKNGGERASFDLKFSRQRPSCPRGPTTRPKALPRVLELFPSLPRRWGRTRVVRPRVLATEDLEDACRMRSATSITPPRFCRRGEVQPQSALHHLSVRFRPNRR